MFLTHIFYLLISSSFTRMLTYSKLKYIINYCSFIDVTYLHLYHSYLNHLTPYLFQIFITTFKMEDQPGIITIDIISLIISMIITEEHGKTIDIIFIDAKQYDGRKDKISKYN